MPAMRPKVFRSMNTQRPDETAKLRRQQRLELQMRENLKRRKAQARARRDAVPDADSPHPPSPESERHGAPDE